MKYRKLFQLGVQRGIPRSRMRLSRLLPELQVGEARFVDELLDIPAELVQLVQAADISLDLRLPILFVGGKFGLGEPLPESAFQERRQGLLLFDELLNPVRARSLGRSPLGGKPAAALFQFEGNRGRLDRF